MRSFKSLLSPPPPATQPGSPADGSRYILPAGKTGAAWSQSAIRSGLALGTASLKDTGVSGANVPPMDGANTWSGVNKFDARPHVKAGGYLVSDFGRCARRRAKSAMRMTTITDCWSGCAARAKRGYKRSVSIPQQPLMIWCSSQAVAVSRSAQTLRSTAVRRRCLRLTTRTISVQPRLGLRPPMPRRARSTPRTRAKRHASKHWCLARFAPSLTYSRMLACFSG